MVKIGTAHSQCNAAMIVAILEQCTYGFVLLYFIDFIFFFNSYRFHSVCPGLFFVFSAVNLVPALGLLLK